MSSQLTDFEAELTSAGAQNDELPPYMFVRNGVYYFKRKTPAKVVRLRPSIRLQVWKSHKTSDLSVALKKHSIQMQKFDEAVNDALFELGASARRVVNFRPRGQGTTQYLLPEHLPSLLKRYEYLYLKSGDEERLGASEEWLAEERAYQVECLRRQKHQFASLNLDCMEETATWLLDIERLIAPPNSEVRKMLLHRLLACDVVLIEEQIRRIDGGSYELPRSEPLGPRQLPTMLDMFMRWRDSEARNPRTVATYEGFVREFEALCGALPVQAITVDHVNRFRDHLASDGLIRATVENYVGALGTLVRAGATPDAQDSKLTKLNVFDFAQLKCVPKRDDSELRRAYEVSELNVLFQSRRYTQGSAPMGQTNESSFWAPVLGPFVGARIEEIAQLRIEDVMCINGVWALRICSLDADQKLKTASSYRMVPLHEEVIRCGFLAYAAKQKRMGHKRLFPSLRNRNKHRTWSNALGKWYSSYIDSIGLIDTRLSFHSHRKTFKQRLTLCSVEDEVRDALTGHWITANRETSGRGYMATPLKQYPFMSLVDAVRKLRYDELDLTHLYVSDPFEGVSVLLEADLDQGAGIVRRARAIGQSARIAALAQ
ncbi:MAG: site-specific integrase [Rhodoferax sp.]|nr:site-specific integrase [Rhodoferax sp.]